MSLVTLSEYGSSRKLQNFWILIPEPSVEDYGVVTIQLSHPACEPKKPRTLHGRGYAPRQHHFPFRFLSFTYLNLATSTALALPGFQRFRAPPSAPVAQYGKSGC